MKAPRLYLCEGYDPLFGPIRQVIKAAGFGDAKTKFYRLHGIQALHVSLER
jgi:hypothetical protein